MPIDPSVWGSDCVLDRSPDGMALYGMVPPDLCDWAYDVAELNSGKPDPRDLQWRLAELRPEVPTWEDCREMLRSELERLASITQFPDPTLNESGMVRVVQWSRDESVRQSVEDRTPGWERRLAAEILRRHDENWADFPHSAVLSYLARHDAELAQTVQGALPGCREVVLKWDHKGDPLSSVALDPATLYLEAREYVKGVVSSTSVIVPTEFIVRRFRDETGADWFRWDRSAVAARDGPPLARLDMASPEGYASRPMRCMREELLDALRSSYRPPSYMLRAIAAWLEKLPITDMVSTKLTLRGPKDESGSVVGWSIPPAFSRQVESRTDATGILSSWYRPRSKEVALERLQELKSFLVTPKMRAILCYVVGAPVVARLAPWRPLPHLELVGQSGAGKTHTAQAAIAVAWGIGDGHREYIGGDVLHSGFRRVDFLSATNLPILIDEASLSRQEREYMRAAANGARTSRGGTDLLHRQYSPTAAPIFTCNASPDESDSSSSEQRGDDRRRIRITFDDSDRDAVSNRAAFERWTRTLPGGPVEPEGEGGGAALHLLNQLTDHGGDLSTLMEVVAAAASEQQLVLDMGATILGIEPVTLTVDDVDRAGEAFLEWLRIEVARWVEIRHSIHAIESDTHPNSARAAMLRADPLLQRIRPEQATGDVPEVADQVHAVYVTAAALEEYKAHRRRIGSTSPYHQLIDLAGLTPITGQVQSDMLGPAADKRSPRGRVVKINGINVRAARIVLPPSPEEPHVLPIDREGVSEPTSE